MQRAALWHGVNGVGQNVDEDLFDFILVQPGRRHFWGKFLDQLDRSGQFVPHHADGLFDQGAEVLAVQIQGARDGEIQQAMDDRVCPLEGIVHVIEDQSDVSIRRGKIL